MNIYICHDEEYLYKERKDEKKKNNRFIFLGRKIGLNI